MTFGEKLKKARLTLNLSQKELADITGIAERSIYNYEQTNTFPKPEALKKLAEALSVTVAYLYDDDEPVKRAKIDRDLFLAKVKKDFGSKGVREARDVFSRAAALFAGGDLDDDTKDVFFQSIMEVYLESKAEARDKFSPKQRAGRRKKVSEAS